MQRTQSSNETLMNFKKVLMNCANNIKYLEQIIIADKLTMKAKKFITSIIDRHKFCIKEVELSITRELAEVIRKEISENDESISFQNVVDMMVLMDDDDRLKLEDYANEILTNKQK